LHRSVAGLLGAWGLAVTIGMLLMGAHAASPGDAGSVPARWPAGGAVRLDGRRPTLLIFLHPRCPCSRASLDELAIILDRCGDRVSAHAVVFRPRPEREHWPPSPIDAALAEIPGPAVHPDRGGDEARRFGVATSGHVLLYDTRGDLVFSGGITPGRGERGDSVGRAALLGRITGERRESPEPPVFGCSLRTPRLARAPGRSR
jgi:hypothetical protein